MAKLRITREIQDRAMAAAQDDELMGICLACGDDAYSVEPDACKYPCESCGERAVYGAQEIILMSVA